MASKLKNAGTGALKKSENIIIERIKKDFSGDKAGKGNINPLLIPEKIRGPKGNAVKKIPYDILDMKSQKLIGDIEQTLSKLSSINPVEEGGFGFDHPGVKSKGSAKKKLKSFPQAEANENIDEYSAMLSDLKMVMNKLASSREKIFSSSSDNNK